MRDTYTPPCAETIAVLGKDQQGIADEADFTRNTIDQILAGNEGDPFLRFKRFYAASVRAGVDVSPWDACLSSIKTRSVIETPQISESHCLSEKINRDADTTQKIVMALENGVIEPHEVPAIRKAITKERDILDVIEAKLEGPERRERVKTVVEARFK